MEEVRRKKMQVREKVGKSPFTMFFKWFVAPEGRKVTSLKRVRSQLARGEMKNCTPLQRRTTFGSWAVEKVHADVARRKFPSQNVQNTACSDHFWKLRCRKSARRCGAKHITKSKCPKHTILRPLLEVEMSKKCTPLLREAHFQVNVYKAHHSQTTFGSCDVEKVYAVVAQSTSSSQKGKKTGGTDNFLTFRCGKSGHWHTTIHSITLLYSYNSNLNFTTTTTTTTATLQVRRHYNYNQNHNYNYNSNSNNNNNNKNKDNDDHNNNNNNNNNNYYYYYYNYNYNYNCNCNYNYNTSLTHSFNSLTQLNN